MSKNANTSEMVDAVDLFLNLTNSDQESFIRKGLEHIKIADAEKAFEDFQKLIDDIEKNNTIFIRAYGRGRDGTRREEYSRFLRYVLKNDKGAITVDVTNNASPSKRFNERSGFNRKLYKNFRLSHVWDGMTKNPYAFCALWNMALTPYFIDPLTGHETNHALSQAFSREFRNLVFDEHKKSIELYNSKMKILEPRVNEFLDDNKNFQGFKENEKLMIKANFKKIEKEL